MNENNDETAFWPRQRVVPAQIIQGRPPYLGKWLWKRKEDQPYWREVVVKALSGGANYCHVYMGWDDERNCPRQFEMEDGDASRQWCGYWILIQPQGDEYLRDNEESAPAVTGLETLSEDARQLILQAIAGRREQHLEPQRIRDEVNAWAGQFETDPGWFCPFS